MAAFVLKIGINFAPEGAFKPNSASEWEGRIFRALKSTSVRHSVSAPKSPQPGDKLFIWTHHYQKRELEPGEGLKATGRVHSVHVDGDGFLIEVSEVEFLKVPIGRYAFTKEENESPVVFSLISRTTTQTLYLDEAQTAEFEAIIAKIETGRETAFPAHHSRLNHEALDKALEKEWDAERRFREQVVEMRPNQPAFRAALLERYQGQCCISGCDAEQGLEAAHIFPFSSGHPDRDKPENGLLLRADIHKLFDFLLIAIDPSDSTVWLSTKLLGTEYEGYNGLPVVHFANSQCLKAHFDRASAM